ncbi:hypothetical protein O181_041787, partial [Austropuccinia psidii MF-1]|nr:hypothetical protein [Austropuccinia psidii MF-1]
LQCENKVEWTAAIARDLCAINDLNIWEIVELENNYKLVGTTWVFKIKKNHFKQTIEHKACLCAQGFTQTPGIDFEKTYAPTGRLNSLRALVAHSCTNNLGFHQIDVESSFLNALLSETVYLSIPQGLTIDCQKYCLRRKRAIYGLKQAPLAWYNHLKNWLQRIGFSECKLDPCVFYCKQPDALWIYIRVDDMVLFERNTQPFKEQISKEFSIKDIGPADLLLGVKIYQLKEGIMLNQHTTNSQRAPFSRNGRLKEGLQRNESQLKKCSQLIDVERTTVPFSVVIDKRTTAENTVLLSQEQCDLTLKRSLPQRSRRGASKLLRRFHHIMNSSLSQSHCFCTLH